MNEILEGMKRKAESYINGYDDGMASYSEWQLAENVLRLIEALEKCVKHRDDAIHSCYLSGGSMERYKNQFNNEIEKTLKGGQP